MSLDPGNSAPADSPVTVEITVSDGRISPNGARYTVDQGATVVLLVTSDVEDEIRADDGGDGYELAVRPGSTYRGTFTADAVGTVEIESSTLDAVIAILDVR